MSTTDAKTLIPTGTWVVDPAHSRVGFAVKHMGIATVRGHFNEYEGRLEVGEDLDHTRAYGTVKTTSVSTDWDQRDEHLRSPDFFDVEQYPELKFESTKIEQVDDETFRIVGNLDMHGVTREITLEAVVDGTDVDPQGNERLGLEVVSQLSRGDFDMKFNMAMGSGNTVVSDKVKLEIDVSAVKQS
ncbi:MAG TPA: YceI family protein [Solirubrobacteraceae bacterium]|jgi:polyisoprenoid-binding protein YceI|nr:YceI family protein [Solirubrobacteraceae bacterium]